MKKPALYWSVTACCLLVSSLWSCSPGDPVTKWNDLEQDELVLNILEFVPDKMADDITIGITNHDWLRQTFHVMKPSANAGSEIVNNYLNQLTRSGMNLDENISHFASGSLICGFGNDSDYIINNPVRYENIGFGPQNVDIDVTITVNADVIEIALGTFDLDAIDDAVSRMDEPVKPDKSEYNGTVVYDWGNGIDLNRKFSPPLYDHLGRGGILAVRQDCIIHAIEMEYVHDVIDACRGTIRSLADDADWTILAESLVGMGTRNYFLSSVVRSYKTIHDLLESVNATETSQVYGLETLDTYIISGSGTATDILGHYANAAVVFTDENTSQENIRKLENRFETGMKAHNTGWPESAEGYHISSNGRVLEIKLRGLNGFLSPAVCYSDLFLAP
ncbi:MAG: hypothetical protein JW712_11205 [Dehalococcoidales bacterium]|nr:hypothetical protein [Dehalococcoidales bacterium]